MADSHIGEITMTQGRTTIITSEMEDDPERLRTDFMLKLIEGETSDERRNTKHNK